MTNLTNNSFSFDLPYCKIPCLRELHGRRTVCAEIAASLRQGMGRLGAPLWHFRCPDSLWEIDSCKKVLKPQIFHQNNQRFPFCMGKNIAWYRRDQGFWSSRLARIGMNDLNLYHY